MRLPANPIGALRNLARLYGEGGIVVDDRPYLRTLIQPDGDVVARVAKSFYALDPGQRRLVLERHLARIRLIERRAKALRRIIGELPGYAWIPASLAFVLGSTSMSVEWLLALLVATGGVGIGFRQVGRLAARAGLILIRRRLRRVIDA